MNASSSPTAPRALSPSRAADFRSCPLKFRYRTIDRLPEPPSAAAARGTLVHAALERMFQAESAERTTERTTASLPDLWAEMLTARPELAGLPEVSDLPTWFEAAAALVRTYFTMEDPTGFQPEACELHLEATVGDGVPVRGIIDRVDVSPGGLIRIVDYKTGRSPAPAWADSALFQLKFYALMLYRLRGVVVARLRLIYLGNAQFLEYTPDEAGLLAFERTVETLWAAIRRATESGDFPPKRSRLCDWCAFKPFCPEFGGTPPPYPLPVGGMDTDDDGPEPV